MQDHEIAASRKDTLGRAAKRAPSATENAPSPVPTDPDLAAVVEAWDRLPEVVRRVHSVARQIGIDREVNDWYR